MPWTHNDNHPAAVGFAGLRYQYQYIIFTNAERLQQLLAVAKWLQVRVVSGLSAVWYADAVFIALHGARLKRDVDGAAAPGTCPPETSSIATSSRWAVFEHDLQHGTWIAEREPVSRARPVAFLGATLWHKGCRKAWVSRDGRAVGGRTSVDDDGAMRMSYSRLVGLDVLYRLSRSPGRCSRRRRRTTPAQTAGWRASNLRP